MSLLRRHLRPHHPPDFHDAPPAPVLDDELLALPVLERRHHRLDVQLSYRFVRRHVRHVVQVVASADPAVGTVEAALARLDWLHAAVDDATQFLGDHEHSLPLLRRTSRVTAEMDASACIGALTDIRYQLITVTLHGLATARKLTVGDVQLLLQTLVIRNCDVPVVIDALLPRDDDPRRLAAVMRHMSHSGRLRLIARYGRFELCGPLVEVHGHLEQLFSDDQVDRLVAFTPRQRATLRALTDGWSGTRGELLDTAERVASETAHS